MAVIDLEMQIHAQTLRSVLVSDDGEEANAVWLPLSQIELVRRRGGIAIVTLPEWLAIEKGLV
ncbi:hypothetical protein KM176_16680 [Pseudooceanicola sp. CBS1P-1]|uniref:Uncharacterized protein n=1 Tax=Pseudooceanicola albus TaxID=2692189 RepID=A0A6L7G6R4_9RHOB|nr:MULTISPECIES: hypothetical protein [Pseudooceanicola]MBT9385512.1 hypothetical protein [Pseudooceanicola endophyticus]MXN19076.1 hypothetical protein [Pseudooceanicola albus]